VSTGSGLRRSFVYGTLVFTERWSEHGLLFRKLLRSCRLWSHPANPASRWSVWSKGN